MKYSVLVLFLVYISISEANPTLIWQLKLNKLQLKCALENNIDLITLNRIKFAKKVDGSDPNVRKLVFCLAIKVGFIDDKGTLNMKIVINHLKKLGVCDEISSRAIKNCNQLEEVDDILLMTINYYMCYGEYVPRYVLVI